VSQITKGYLLPILHN